MATNNAWNTPELITSVGTLTTGTWNATLISPTYGGTGINNASRTITIGGNVAFTGAFTFTGALTATTSVTFPTSGVLIAVPGSTSLTTLGTVTTGTYSAILKDYTETATAANSSTAYAIDMANGNVFTLTLTGNCTLTISNVPASGCVSLTIILIQGAGPYTVTWPASFVWPNSIAPTLSTTSGRVDVFTAISTNAGTTFRAFISGQNFTA